MCSSLWLTVGLGQKTKTSLTHRCSELLLDGWINEWINEMNFGFPQLYCVLVSLCLHLCYLLSLREETHVIFQDRVHYGKLSMCWFSVAVDSMKPRPGYHLTIHGVHGWMSKRASY